MQEELKIGKSSRTTLLHIIYASNTVFHSFIYLFFSYKRSKLPSLIADNITINNICKQYYIFIVLFTYLFFLTNHNKVVIYLKVLAPLNEGNFVSLHINMYTMVVIPWELEAGTTIRIPPSGGIEFLVFFPQVG
jgi:hypothetical protein